MLCRLGRCLLQVLFPLGCMFLGDDISLVCFAFVGLALVLPTKSSSLPPMVPVLDFIFKMSSVLIFFLCDERWGCSFDLLQVPTQFPQHYFSDAILSPVCVLGTFVEDQSAGDRGGTSGLWGPFLWSVRLLFCPWHTSYTTMVWITAMPCLLCCLKIALAI